MERVKVVENRAEAKAQSRRVTLFVTIAANPGMLKPIVGVRAGIKLAKVRIRNP
jgi:hypothetical protein